MTSAMFPLLAPVSRDVFLNVGRNMVLLVKNDIVPESQKPRINRKNKPNKKPSQNGSEVADQARC